MLAVTQALASIAASGSLNVTVPLPTYGVGLNVGPRSLGFRVGANWANASASGLSIVIQYSGDGSTFHNSAQIVPLLTAAATGEVEANFVYHLADNPFRLDAGPIESLKSELTNNDSSHAVTVFIASEDERHLGY